MLREMLTATLRPVVEGLGYVLWDLEYAAGRGNGLVRIFIDAGQPITLDDCERVSRAVGDVLDAADLVPGHYTLEVSSPGIERPLRTAAHFAAYVGEPVFVELAAPVDGRRRFKGPLLDAGPESIEMEVDGRRHVLPVAGIRKAHLAPDV
jgi:ribosome maturation factor RimP